MGIPEATTRYDIAEVRFKGGRKEYFRNSNNYMLTTGDAVVVEMSSGYHIGYVSMQGELVKLQIKKKNLPDDYEIKTIQRIATPKDLEKFDQAKAREMSTMYRVREIVIEQKLEMKLSDVEYQADNSKATFYYSAEERVDFRELIKILASEFKIRVEMKQISLRQEAGRVGGIGVCGRELCCSTWLTDFKNVNTNAARYQNLSLNPVKLSGQCGRLKCCLNYELDTYIEALKGIPEVERPLLTEKGDAKLQKTDIFRRIMWFGYQEESNWIPLTVEQVKLVQELNSQGIRPADLVETETKEEKVKTKSPENLEIDIKKFDKTNSKNFTKKKKKKGSGQPRPGNPPQGGTPQAQTTPPLTTNPNQGGNPNNNHRNRNQSQQNRKKQ
ncbi:MAG TPA: regulatory iron-sulfur-containing complex subunit RicT [Cytophagales bacterium]|nr:regulatory iron-sulfur-containing complex subunit RicT [Cytophagales bacterium]